MADDNVGATEDQRRDYDYDCSDGRRNDDGGDEAEDRRSICVNPKTCVIHFEPGRTYTRRIKLSNTTAGPQIIRVTRPPEGKIFKFSHPNTVTVPPNGSCDLPFTFTSHSNQEFKSYIRLENSTGRRGNNLRDVELRAVPKAHSSLPRTINFGNVDIGTSVSRKFSLAPESNPYQFRIFIPRALDGLRVNPTCGKVLSDSPADVTVVYTPQSYITLRVDLVLYLSADGSRKPQIITLTADTKPKTNRIQITKMKKKTTTRVVHVPPVHRSSNRDKTEKDITAFNRLTMNKMLAHKQTLPDDPYAWLNALGESDKAYRESYSKSHNDFVAKANRFGDEHKRARVKVARCEVAAAADELVARVDGLREAEWNAYEDKLYSYRNVSCDDQAEPTGFRERSIRTNCVDASRHDFDPNADDNWCTRFQAYNKFVTAVKSVVIKNRLEKRLDGFRALMQNNLII